MLRLLLPPLQKALNRVLALDAETQARLRQLNGHVIKIELLTIDQVFFLTLEQDQLQLRETSDIAPDIIIQATPTALFQMVSRQQDLYGSDVKITGDMGVGQAIKDIFSQIDIDWEEGISHYTGDVVARGVTQGLRKIHAWQRRTHENLQQDYKEYLQEEIELLPRREAFNTFCQQVTTLRDDVERLVIRAGLSET